MSVPFKKNTAGGRPAPVDVVGAAGPRRRLPTHCRRLNDAFLRGLKNTINGGNIKIYRVARNDQSDYNLHSDTNKLTMVPLRLKGGADKNPAEDNILERSVLDMLVDLDPVRHLSLGRVSPISPVSNNLTELEVLGVPNTHSSSIIIPASQP